MAKDTFGGQEKALPAVWSKSCLQDPAVKLSIPLHFRNWCIKQDMEQLNLN